MKPLLLLLATATLSAAAESAKIQADEDYFETHVRPLLASKCYTCHTDAKSGGLQLDSREHVLAGGKSGPAIVPGDPDHSLLIQAIRQTHPRLKMPPGGKLKDEEIEIEAVAAWVKNGAVWPAGPVKPPQYTITSEQRAFWSFQPVAEPVPSKVKNTKCAQNDIDRFILAKLEENGLAPARPADWRTLIRRAYLDLTGLPPAPEANRLLSAFAFALATTAGSRNGVAVGTIITDRPPHGSVLALLTHTVLTLGVATKVRVV
jgi:mono/diheme cytochrome c family protein